MATTTEITDIKTASDGFIFCAKITTVDGVNKVHRYGFPPGTDLNSLDADVKAAVQDTCDEAWTDEVIAAFNA